MQETGARLVFSNRNDYFPDTKYRAECSVAKGFCYHTAPAVISIPKCRTESSMTYDLLPQTLHVPLQLVCCNDVTAISRFFDS